MSFEFNDIDPLNKILISGRFKVLRCTILNYRWDVLDLKQNQKYKYYTFSQINRKKSEF